MGFDNEIAAIEGSIRFKNKELYDLESMCSDAQMARDMAKVSVAKLIFIHAN